jgi:hypothetical protein
MGLLSKIIAAKVTSSIVQKLNQKGRDPVPQQPVARQQYIPARTTMRGRAFDVRDRAVNVYRDNPKLVAGVGLLAAAMLLQQMKKR